MAPQTANAGQSLGAGSRHLGRYIELNICRNRKTARHNNEFFQPFFGRIGMGEILKRASPVALAGGINPSEPNIQHAETTIDSSRCPSQRSTWQWMIFCAREITVVLSDAI